MSDAAGGSSTQRSFVPAQSAVFDLHNEDDVVTLLQRVHQSILDAETKNELRDAVFAFRTAGAAKLDVATKELFAAQGFVVTDVPAAAAPTAVEPVAEQSVEQPSEAATPAPGFGNARPTPHFGAVVAHELPTEAPAPAATVQAEAAPASAAEMGVTKAEVAAPQPEPKQDEVVPVSSATGSAPTSPAVEPTPAPTGASPASAPSPAAPVDETQAPAAPAAAAGGLMDGATASDRITAIKHEVNAMVGNPVHLLDIDNDLGRMYMNALLDAMKKLNGASPAELKQAVDRLEASFASVKELMEKHGGTPLADVAVQSPAPAATEEPSPADQTAPTETAPAAPTETPATSSPVPPPAAPTSTATPEPAAEPQSEPTPAAAPETVAPSTAPEKAPESVAAPAPAPEAPQRLTSSVPRPAGQQVGIRSVADVKAGEEAVLDQKRAAATTEQQKEAAAVAALDPLMRPDVNAGLEQLLSEWALFKQSGIFGTGPHGSEHPLYKKLAGLTMAAVLAGRFEGATPAIKRGITDVMNGWRYENGIVHEQGETFEHYLRRVVRFVIDNPKDKKEKK